MTHETRATTPFLMDRSRLGRGLVGFAALTVAGLGILFAFTLKGDLADVTDHLSAGFMLLAALGMVADFLIGAVRYQIFLRRIRPGTSLWLPIKADLAARFVGAVTPSQTGGGPAQVFILWKGGIPIPAALSFLMINFVSTLVFFLMAGSFTAWVLRGSFSHGALQYLIQWSFVAFAGGLIFMIVGLVRPDLVVRLVSGLVRRLEASPRGWAQAAARGGRFLVDSAEEYRQKCVEFTRDAPWLVVASFVLTVVLYLNKFTLAWLVMRGLGVDGDFGLTLAVQALLHFILYVAPTPGGSGIAELSMGALMAVLLPTDLLGPFTLAYRFFILYLPAAVGAVVLAYALRPRAKTVNPVTTGAVVTALILSVVGAASPGAGQNPPELPPVEMARVRPLVGGSLVTTVATQKQRLLDALARGLAKVDNAAAEGDFTLAVDVGRYLVAAAPDDADAHYLLSVALGLRLETAGLRQKISMGDETRREAEIALRLDPDHAGAHYVMGRLYAGAMRLSPVARFVAQRILGANALRDVSWERAEYHLSRARDIEPDNPRPSTELGVLYIDTKRYGLAFAELTRACAAPAVQASDSLVVARACHLLSTLPCPDEGNHPVADPRGSCSERRPTPVSRWPGSGR